MDEQSVALLDSLYDSGDLSVDQHAGIMRGFLALRAEITRLNEQLRVVLDTLDGMDTPIGALTLVETWRAEKRSYMERIAQLESAIEVVARHWEAQD